MSTLFSHFSSATFTSAVAYHIVQVPTTVSSAASDVFHSASFHLSVFLSMFLARLPFHFVCWFKVLEKKKKSHIDMTCPVTLTLLDVNRVHSERWFLLNSCRETFWRVWTSMVGVGEVSDQKKKKKSKPIAGLIFISKCRPVGHVSRNIYFLAGCRGGSHSMRKLKIILGRYGMPLRQIFIIPQIWSLW